MLRIIAIKLFWRSDIVVALWQKPMLLWFPITFCHVQCAAATAVTGLSTHWSFSLMICKLFIFNEHRPLLPGNPEICFSASKVGDGGGGVNAICCGLEVPDDVIYGEDVDTFGYWFVQICGLLASEFNSLMKSAIYTMRRRRLVHLSPIS